MKIKSDFITNSSSSSFLVAFDKLPETVDEMKKILFGEREEYVSPWDAESYWKTSLVAEMVLNDTHPYVPGSGVDDYGYYFYSQDELKAFIEANEGKVFSAYEYSDNDGQLMSAMEHGDLFRRLPHYRESKH